jgi:tetratricopeptide (TPR) repeat protein
VRRLIESIRKTLSDFVEQRDDLVCLLACTDDDAPVLLKILADLEQAADTDIFLLFADDFIQGGPYVSVAVERLAEQHRLASEWAVEKQREPLAAMPPELFDDAQLPTRRLFDAITFAKSLVPQGGGNRLVWVMCPSAGADQPEYFDLLSSLLPRDGPQPWMRGLRLIFRVPPEVESMAPDLVEVPRVRVTPVDLGPEAMENAMQHAAVDEELPEDERMQSVLSLALLDAAHDRSDDAAKKFELLLGYYQRTGNLAMQAFVINAFGDVYYKAEDLDGALHWYECAAAPAAEAGDAVILATVVKNLGDVSYQRGDFQRAEAYYDGLDQLGAHMLQPETKITALEWRGLSQEQQRDYDGAVESWQAAATLSRNIGLPDFLRTNLTHLQRVYEQTSRGGPLAEVNEELRALEMEDSA